MEMRRSIIMNCVKDDSYLPEAYNWLYKYHVNESISQFQPYVTKYATYRALPIPPQGVNYGTYNWIMTEHYWLINPFENVASNMPNGLAFTEYWPENFMEITNQPPTSTLRERKWMGTKDGYHPIIFAFLPLFWEMDFKGAGRTIEDGPNYRWQIVFKYPEGVDPADGDAWFVNELAPAIVSMPEVNRFVSSKILDVPRTSPFHRVAEIWFNNSREWYKAIVEGGTNLPKPTWATEENFPFVEPYKDFAGIFLLDRPESDHLTQFNGYRTCR